MTTQKDETNATPKYRDRLFRAIFDDPDHRDWLLSLYNAVNGSSYTNVEDLESTTLDDVIYMKMKNDVSFILNNQMSLYEHQTSYSPNLPLRGFLYYAELLRQKYHDHKIYSTSRIKIATPSYIVFYNGNQEIEESCVLRMSDSFEVPLKKGEPIYEWSCKVLNINKGKNKKLIESCRALQDYVEYVSMVKENLSLGKGLNSAVEEALDKAVDLNLLDGYFNRHRARIKAMSLTEYNEEEAKKVFHDDGYNEGVAAGIEAGMQKGLEVGAARQKAEDEAIIQKKEAELQQKMEDLKNKDTEIARILEENKKMKAQLAARD